MCHLWNNSKLTQVLLVSIVCVVACSSSDQEDEFGYFEEIIDGIRVQVFAETHKPPIDPFNLEKSVTYGSDQGGDTYLLSRPFPMGLGADENLYVMDPMTTIHRFTHDGVYLDQFFTRGQGPGEFMMLQDLIVDRSMLFSADLMLGRMNIFDLEGTWLRSIPFPGETRRSPYWTIRGQPSNRQFLIWRQGVTRNEAVGTANYSLSLLDEQLRVVATPIDTFSTFEQIQAANRWHSTPFKNDLPSVALAPDLPVAWSDGSEFRVDFYSAQSGDRWATITPHDPLPVTEAMKRQFFDNYQRRDEIEQVRRHIRFPEHTAHIRDIANLPRGDVPIKI